MDTTRDLVIFSDLDACLLDHDGYSWQAARPALDLIRAESIPLVLVTSKTRPEVEAIRSVIGIEDPFVVENGGGIFWPRGALDAPPLEAEEDGPYLLVRLGRPYEEIRRFVDSLPERFGVRGFGDMTVDEIARRTGLASTAATRARQRDFTEPFLIDRPEALPELETRAAAEGLEITQGGRFHHLMAAGQNKGRATLRCLELLERERRRPLRTIGLGDSPNDLPLLGAVDRPIVVPRPDGRHLETGLDGVVNAPYPGSRGWNDALLRTFAELRPSPIHSDGHGN